MLALIQRVKSANVTVENTVIGSIGQGLLILCGFESTDTEENCQRLLQRCFDYRIFSDHHDKMNLSLLSIEGMALIVPQFTLVANTKRGLRPSFSNGMPPTEGKQLFGKLQSHLQTQHVFCQFGQFGADMKVSLCNDGPVTFLLEG